MQALQGHCHLHLQPRLCMRHLVKAPRSAFRRADRRLTQRILSAAVPAQPDGLLFEGEDQGPFSEPVGA